MSSQLTWTNGPMTVEIRGSALKDHMTNMRHRLVSLGTQKRPLLIGSGNLTQTPKKCAI